MRHDGKMDRSEATPAPVLPGVPDQGIVFDFSGREMPDMRELTLLVTARMLAEQDERPVWVRALPHRSWELLEAMGLAHLFRFFPAGGAQGN